jgi:hypothetical protein
VSEAEKNQIGAVEKARSALITVSQPHDEQIFSGDV